MSRFPWLRPIRRWSIAGAVLMTSLLLAPRLLAQAPTADPDAPVVTKVEPPNWWVRLTPDLMLLLTGQHLDATKISCNLDDVIVSRTESSGNGNYLFVWLRFGPNLKSGTAVCRLTTRHGQTSFELPLAARKQILGRNQGLTPDDVLYLIMPDRFANGDPTNDEPAEFPNSYDRSKPRAYHGGDLRGIRDHLPYLKDLGVTTLWLTPIVKNGAANEYHGYSAVDLWAVDPHLGSLSDYQELVQAAHQQHMKIFFDAVPNHVGPRNPWVANPPLPDWFHGTAQAHLSTASPYKADFYGQPANKPAMNDLFELLEDPHTQKQERQNLTDGWFVNHLPDLNTENPIVVDYLIQNAMWWAESSGLDGFRIDTFPYISRPFWEKWHTSLRQVYPRLSTIGEVFHPDPTVTSFFVGGRKGWDGVDTQLTTVFDFPMYFAMRDVLLNGASAGKLTNILRQDSLYPHPDYLVPFFANHDTTRFAGIAGVTPAKDKLAFGLILTLRGIPQIYYADELGMGGGGDPDNRHDFPGGWKEDQQNAFTPAGRTPAQQDIFNYVQSLLALRKQHSSLRGGKLWHLSVTEDAYVFLRQSDEETLVVAFTRAVAPTTMNIPLRDTVVENATTVRSIFGAAQADIDTRTLRLKLPAESLSIFDIH